MAPKFKTSAYLARAMKRLRSFYKEDPESQCWIWHGPKVNNKDKKAKTYGKFSFGGKWRLAHRVSYALHKENLSLLDNPKLICMHRCDNRLCVNPKHITLGTHTDNMADMVAKGRQSQGIVCLCCHRPL